MPLKRGKPEPNGQRTKSVSRKVAKIAKKIFKP